MELVNKSVYRQIVSITNTEMTARFVYFFPDRFSFFFTVKKSIGAKVGVPVMLYDSDPEQPTSLYLRSGLCFTCQRMLNEKRRTQRKRKSDANPTPVHHHPMEGPPGGLEYYPEHLKRFRYHGEILELGQDAIIVNGPIEGTKTYGPGYEFPQIGLDLQKITHDVFQNTSQLINTVNSLNEVPTNVNSQDNAHIESMHKKAFESASKACFLLNQWKLSWDTTVANAAAEKAEEHVLERTSMNVPNADVVASAAAVAAAQSVSSDQNSASMIPLLLSNKRDMDQGEMGLTPDHGDDDDDDKPEIFGV